MKAILTCFIFYSGLVLGQCPFTFTFTTTNPQCNGSNDGSINISIVGSPASSPNYSTTITDTSNTLYNLPDSTSAFNLPPGLFTITIVDSAGCTLTDSFQLINPEPLVPVLSTISPFCGGGNATSGSIIVDSVYNAQGNPGLVQYLLTPNPNLNVNPFDGTFNNLFAGTYVLQITDEVGCDELYTVLLDNGPQFSYVNGTVYSSTISGSNSTFLVGEVECAVFGGVSPYSYTWTNLQTGTTTNDSVWSDLPLGDYTIEVTDALGCTIYDTISLGLLNTDLHLPDLITVYPNPVNNGQIHISDASGKSLILYDHTGRIVLQHEINHSTIPLNVSAGLYHYLIMDNNESTVVSTGKLIVAE